MSTNQPYLRLIRKSIDRLYWLWLGFLIIYTIVWLTARYGPADLQATCAKHDGVQQIIPAWFTPVLKGNLVLVCKDGKVYNSIKTTN